MDYEYLREIYPSGDIPATAMHLSRPVLSKEEGLRVAMERIRQCREGGPIAEFAEVQTLERPPWFP
jgi:hypothetical protein